VTDRQTLGCGMLDRLVLQRLDDGVPVESGVLFGRPRDLFRRPGPAGAGLGSPPALA
jgi:hypothetical protein